MHRNKWLVNPPASKRYSVGDFPRDFCYIGTLFQIIQRSVFPVFGRNIVPLSNHKFFSDRLLTVCLVPN